MVRAPGAHLAGPPAVGWLVAVDPADDRFPAPEATTDFHDARIGRFDPEDERLRALPLPLERRDTGQPAAWRSASTACSVAPITAAPPIVGAGKGPARPPAKR